MATWSKTGCVLCAQNCGLEFFINNNRITRVRPDRDNPRSRGYACQKGLSIASYQHHADRLTHPLKRIGKRFQTIPWSQAIAEIAAALRDGVDRHGPHSFAYVGGGGQGSHFEAAFGRALMKGLGSHYHYSAIAQELTGYFWTCGRHNGRQHLFYIPDEEEADMLMAVGWNGMESHQMPRAPLVLREFAKNPDKILAVIDPRLSKTAEIANIHLAVRPGSDALLAKAMIGLIVQNGWQHKEYLAARTGGSNRVLQWFADFDVAGALRVCELDLEEVTGFCRLLSTRRWCMHTDLGIYMNRHSTVTSYLYNILAAICGRLCVSGGNVIPGRLMPLGSHSDERSKRTWRTVATGFPLIMGYAPPNVLPEEIDNNHADRLRSVIVSNANPLRSYADTTAYERAFKQLDLLVTIDVAMTETAELSDYVLPARSPYESWDSTFFTWSYPEIYFQMRRPLLKAKGEPLESGEIFTRLASALDLVPSLPPSLQQAARHNNLSFTLELLTFLRKHPKAGRAMPFILALTLGRKLGSGNLACLWGLLQTAPQTLQNDMERAGFSCPSKKDTAFAPATLGTVVRLVLRHKSLTPLAGLLPQVHRGEKVFQAILDNPQGIWLGRTDPDSNFDLLQTESKKIELFIAELEEWVADITPEREQSELDSDPDFPLILSAGSHMPANANTQMRDPKWNDRHEACTLHMHPTDAASLGLADRQHVLIRTAAGEERTKLEISQNVRQGQVILPHGFGLKFQGQVYGANVNRLTRSSHRDSLAATPLHRYVRCRVEAA